MTLPSVEMRVLEATETGQWVEFLYDDGSNDDVVVCAAHGGRIEPGTGEQAIELAVGLPNATCWGCFGYDEEAEEFDLWHPASASFAAADYPLLARIADRGFETVVSLHGQADGGVLVGGGLDADVKRRVRDRLDEALAAAVATVSDGPYAGMSPNNFVNWLAREEVGGLQLEQGPEVRDDEADTVVTVLEQLVGADVI